MNLAYFLSQYINQNANHRKKKKPYFVWLKIAKNGKNDTHDGEFSIFLREHQQNVFLHKEIIKFYNGGL